MRISKEKMKFAKDGEQNISTEIFRKTKVIDRRPLPVYELEDLNKASKERQLHGDELTPVRISNQTTYNIDELLGKQLDEAFRSISSNGEVTVRNSTLGYQNLA